MSWLLPRNGTLNQICLINTKVFICAVSLYTKDGTLLLHWIMLEGLDISGIGGVEIIDDSKALLLSLLPFDSSGNYSHHYYVL